MERGTARFAEFVATQTNLLRNIARKRTRWKTMVRSPAKYNALGSTFLGQICEALDQSPQELAENMGIARSELEAFMVSRNLLPDMDRHEIWWALNEYVNQRLALILAARAQLNRALQRDRKKRAARVAAFISRTPKGSPRGSRSG
jgi:hypothetical protein